MPAKSLNGSEKFLRLLERNVKSVLLDDDATTENRLAAINAGAKLLAIRHKIEAGDSSGFFG
jgi:hypothetical protein